MCIFVNVVNFISFRNNRVIDSLPYKTMDQYMNVFDFNFLVTAMWRIGFPNRTIVQIYDIANVIASVICKNGVFEQKRGGR